MNIFAMNGTQRRNGVDVHCDGANEDVCDLSRIHCSADRVCSMKHSPSLHSWHCEGECGDIISTTSTSTFDPSHFLSHSTTIKTTEEITSDLFATTTVTTWRRAQSTDSRRNIDDISVNMAEDQVNFEVDPNANRWNLQIVLYLVLGGLLGGGAFCVCILCGICCFLRERVHEQRKKLEQDSMSQSFSSLTTSSGMETDSATDSGDEASYSMTSSTKRYYLRTTSGSRGSATSRNLSSGPTRSKSECWKYAQNTPSFGSMVIHDLKGAIHDLTGIELLDPVEEEELDGDHGDIPDIDDVDDINQQRDRDRNMKSNMDRNMERNGDDIGLHVVFEHEHSQAPPPPQQSTRNIMAYSDAMELFVAQNRQNGKTGSLALSDAVPLPLPMSSTAESAMVDHGDGDEKREFEVNENVVSLNEDLRHNMPQTVLFMNPSSKTTVEEKTSTDISLKLNPSKSSNIRSVGDSNDATRGTESSAIETDVTEATGSTASEHNHPPVLCPSVFVFCLFVVHSLF